MIGLYTASLRPRMMIAAIDDADARGRQHPTDVVPSRVLVKDADGADVADEQHWQHDAGRFTRAEEEREDQHVHEAHASEPRLADADSCGGGHGRQIHWAGCQMRQMNC